jgi:hypothetical protein
MAHMGARYRDRLTGTFGHLATSSFYPAHHITTGEGGMVVTDREDLARIARSIRDWGRDCYCAGGENNTCGKRFSQQFGSLPYGYDHKYVYSHLGYNLKATDMQAAIGNAQLARVDAFVRDRRCLLIAIGEARRRQESLPPRGGRDPERDRVGVDGDHRRLHERPWDEGTREPPRHPPPVPEHGNHRWRRSDRELCQRCAIPFVARTHWRRWSEQSR